MDESAQDLEPVARLRVAAATRNDEGDSVCSAENVTKSVVYRSGYNL